MNASTSTRRSGMRVTTTELPWDTGNAIVFARLARDDEDMISAAAERLVTRVREQGIEPRLLMKVVGSGSGDFNDRDDLLGLVQYAREGWCKWIVVSDYACISRSLTTFAACVERLDAAGVKLVALDNGGRFEPYSEIDHLAALALRAWGEGSRSAMSRRMAAGRDAKRRQQAG